jgi:5-methylcytosine-specific restriction endonuclease McrA
LTSIPNQIKDTRAAVIARDKRTCQYCGKSKLYKTQLHLDHVVADSVGGGFTLDNLVVACKQCNFRKGKKPVSQYINDRLEALAREKASLERFLAERLF